MLDVILIFIIGAIVSAFGSLTGFGGGIFMVPILVIAFHLPITSAIGAVSVALFPLALISSIYNHKENMIDYTAGILLEIPTIGGAVFGALLTAWIPVQKLEFIFAFFVFFMGLQMLIEEKREGTVVTRWLNKLNKVPPSFKRKTETGVYHFSALMTTFFGLMAGTIAGMFGVGGGFLKGPIMIKVFKIPARIAASTALFMIIFTSLTSSVTHYYLGHIHLRYALPVTIGYIIGAFIGNHFNRFTSDDKLKTIIGIALFLAGFTILYDIFFR